MRWRAEYDEKCSNNFEIVGIDCLLLRMLIPMSSANARSVDDVGRCFSTDSNNGSMHNTNRVGERGHPCLTPEQSVKEGCSPSSRTSW